MGRCGAKYCTWRFRVNTWVRRLTVARATGCGCGRRAVSGFVQRELETDEERSRMIKSKAKFLAAPCHGLNSLTFSIVGWRYAGSTASREEMGELRWGVREGVLARWHDSPYTSMYIYIYLCVQQPFVYHWGKWLAVTSETARTLPTSTDTSATAAEQQLAIAGSLSRSNLSLISECCRACWLLFLFMKRKRVTRTGNHSLILGYSKSIKRT